MEEMDVIDRFLETFIRYIDSGFGLLQGDVAYLTSTLIVIDITLAGLFWALSQNADVIAGLIKKVLYVGFFAFLLGNFAGLSQIIFDSFAGLGLKAGSSLITAEDLMRPGYIAGVGYGAALPLLEEAGEMMGPIAFFENFILIAVLLIAWAVILIAFFVLAVQLFVSILEFKLTTLAGFVLVPFALWNKTSFLAERVLGNVITSGLKLMVLAIIIGIGSTLFSTITEAFAGTEDVTLAEVMGTVLAATVFLWMGVFGPGMASGLITGAPQLGAGSAIGAAAGVAAGTVAAGLGARAALGAAAGGAASAVKAGRLDGRRRPHGVRSRVNGFWKEWRCRLCRRPWRRCPGGRGHGAPRGLRPCQRRARCLPARRARRVRIHRRLEFVTLRNSVLLRAGEEPRLGARHAHLAARRRGPPARNAQPARRRSRLLGRLPLPEQQGRVTPCASNAPQPIMAPRPTLRRPTRRPDRSGTSGSARPGSRRRTGG
jgi:type IV secretion system protein TrbL